MNTHTRIKQILFTPISPEEIERMAVVEVTESKVFDKNIPIINGLYDLRMGSVDSRSGECITCRNSGHNREKCVGHYGYIKLALPVYNIVYLPYVVKILKVVCHHCGKIIVKKIPNHVVDVRKIEPLHNLAHALRTVKRCEYCNHICPTNVNIGETGITVYVHQGKKREKLSANSALKIFNKLTSRTIMDLGLDPKYSRPSWMIWQNLLVMPPVARSPVIQDGIRIEDPIVSIYIQILKENGMLNNTLARQQEDDEFIAEKKVSNLTDTLTLYVAILFNRDILKKSKKIRVNQKINSSSRTLKQRIDGKEGRITGNLMGKRINFSARTVISCDPILGVETVGVPIEIATEITFPEIVDSNNIKRLQTCVYNGHDIYPGAKTVKKRGYKHSFNLEYAKPDSIVLEYGDTVERHLIDGDYMAFNRQPTLHKTGIMGHKIKVFRNAKTFRLNISATSPYNADFDGDEMNGYYVQSYETLAEVRDLMNIVNFIISPQDSGPAITIVQDGLLGIGKLSQSDLLLEIHDVFYILSYFDQYFRLPKPHKIVDGVRYWTGRQIFSLLIPNININQLTSVYNTSEIGQVMTDARLLIENGEHLSGIFDNKGLVKIVSITNNEFTPRRAVNFIDNANRLSTLFLIRHGSTIGFDDIFIADPEFYNQVDKFYADGLYKSEELIEDIDRGILTPLGMTMIDFIDNEITSKMNKVRDMSYKLFKAKFDNPIRDNQLLGMALIGSKGNPTNIGQIIACTGQQSVSGSRIPLSYGGRSLPCFHRGDISPEAQGFIRSSFTNGLKSYEHFFSAISGREGRIDTQVKMGEVGYFTKKLIKKLEDIFVQFDTSVIDTTGRFIQPIYGGDGIDAMKLEKQYFLYTKQGINEMEAMYKWSNAELKKYSLNKKQTAIVVSEYDQLVQDKVTIFSDLYKAIYQDVDTPIKVGIDVLRIIENSKNRFEQVEKSDLTPYEVVMLVSSLIESLPNTYNCADPRHKPFLVEAIYLLSCLLRNYLNSKKIILIDKMSKEMLTTCLEEIVIRFSMAMVNPGEGVGILAAHAISEPTSQCTLDSFHKTGSLSIIMVVPPLKRLKEILTFTSKQKVLSTKIFPRNDDIDKLKEYVKFFNLKKYAVKSEIIYDKRFQIFTYSDDSQIINDYIENTPNYSINHKNLGQLTIRIVLDKVRMIYDQMGIGKLVHKIKKKFPQLYVYSSSDNAVERILYIKLNKFSKKVQKELSKVNGNEIKVIQDYEQEIINSTLSGVDGIGEISIGETKGEQIFNPQTMEFKPVKNTYIEAVGSNLQELLSSPLVDTSRTISNNLPEIYSIFGIEVVRSVMISEIYKQIESASDVLARHINILVEKVCFSGIPLSIEHSGIKYDHSGIMNVITFERNSEQIIKSSIYSEGDDCTGVSANVLLGQDFIQGTGIMSEFLLDSEKFGMTEEDINELEEL